MTAKQDATQTRRRVRAHVVTSQSGISVTRGPRKFTVRERVVFEYVYRIHAASKADARRVITEIGDGEASEHNEGARRVSSVTEGWDCIDPGCMPRERYAQLAQRKKARE